MSHALSLLILLALCAEVSRVKLIRIFDKVRLCGEQVTLGRQASSPGVANAQCTGTDNQPQPDEYRCHTYIASQTSAG